MAIRRSLSVRRPGPPGVAEDAYWPGALLPADGEQLGPDGREHLEVGERVERLPSGVAECLVGANRKGAAAHRAREDRVEDVTSPWSRVDGLAQQQQPADLDTETGLLEELAGRRFDHGLARVHTSAGDEPVRVATLLVADQQDLCIPPDEHGDPDPDGALSHGSIIG